MTSSSTSDLIAPSSAPEISTGNTPQEMNVNFTGVPVLIMKNCFPSSVHSLGVRINKNINPLPYRCYRHYSVPTPSSLPNPIATQQLEATEGGFVNISPRKGPFVPQIISLRPKQTGITRHAIIKRKYRSNPGVRDKENAARRKKYQMDKKEYLLDKGVNIKKPLDVGSNLPNGVQGILHQHYETHHVQVIDLFTCWVPAEACQKNDIIFHKPIGDEERTTLECIGTAPSIAAVPQGDNAVLNPED